MVFLTGHSGAGKSTLMKLIMLMERPSQGQVFVDGRNLNRLSAGQIPYYRRNVGVVFQNHQLLFDRSVFDNVALPLLIAGSILPKSGAVYAPPWIKSGCSIKNDKIRSCSRAANNSVSALHALSSINPLCFSPMNQPVTLIRNYQQRS